MQRQKYDLFFHFLFLVVLFSRIRRSRRTVPPGPECRSSAAPVCQNREMFLQAAPDRDSGSIFLAELRLSEIGKRFAGDARLAR